MPAFIANSVIISQAANSRMYAIYIKGAFVPASVFYVHAVRAARLRGDGASIVLLIEIQTWSICFRTSSSAIIDASGVGKSKALNGILTIKDTVREENAV